MRLTWVEGDDERSRGYHRCSAIPVAEIRHPGPPSLTYTRRWITAVVGPSPATARTALTALAPDGDARKDGQAGSAAEPQPAHTSLDGVTIDRRCRNIHVATCSWDARYPDQFRPTPTPTHGAGAEQQVAANACRFCRLADHLDDCTGRVTSSRHS